MTKSAFLLIACLAIIGSSSFTLQPQPAPVNSAVGEDRYKVVSAMEFDKYGKGTMVTVISNVTHVKCEQHSKEFVILEFSKYYNAYYKKNRDGASVSDPTVYSFDSRDKAEKKRRELLASTEEWKRTPLLMEGFSVLCDD